MDAVRQLVVMHAVFMGLHQSSVNVFLQNLVPPATMSARGAESSSEGHAILVSKLWTSTSQFRGKELSMLINAALRADRNPALKPAIQIVNALSSLHLERMWPAPSKQWWPVDGRVYRGGWIPSCHLDFFSEGQQFRSVTALACIFDYSVALGIAQRKAAPSDGRLPVVWIMRLDPIRRCANAYLLDSELLFAPYACFRVERFQRQEHAVAETPHCIELFAYPDREGEPGAESWPVAPWS